MYHIILTICLLGTDIRGSCIEHRFVSYTDEMPYSSLETCVDALELRFGKLLGRPGWQTVVSNAYCAH